MNEVVYAFMMTLIAGLSTGIGSLIALVTKSTNRKFLSVSLGFSAGVMIYVSLMEILPKAQEGLSLSLGAINGNLVAIVSFFVGMAVIALIDKMIPSEGNPHEVKSLEEGSMENEKLMRMGVFTAIAIAIHNFPEGLTTFVSALQEPNIAIPIVIAIALHNIPEGIAVSVPIYHATGSRKKAFIYSFASGLAEPIGALVGWFLLMPIMNEVTNGILFAMVAGIMVFISFDELLPSAKEYGEHHLSLYGMIFGMAFMAFSLLLFV